MKAEEILQTLDTQFEVVGHDPPHLYQLWTHFYPADTRLTAFRSDNQWAVVFEILGYWCRPQVAQLDIYLYGSRVLEQTAHYEMTPLEMLDSHTGRPLDGTGSVDPNRFSALWHGQRYDFAPLERDYAEAGIAFDAGRADPQAHATAQVIRYLCERLNHPFFLPETDLRQLLAQSWASGAAPGPDTLSMLLQTRAWHHPSLSREELPSQVRSFQILASALENGSIAEWDRQDTASFNTDWRIYDWEEKMEEEQRRVWADRQEKAWASLPVETRERLAGEAASAAEGIIIRPNHTAGDEGEAV